MKRKWGLRYLLKRLTFGNRCIEKSKSSTDTILRRNQWVWSKILWFRGKRGIANAVERSYGAPYIKFWAELSFPHPWFLLSFPLGFKQYEGCRDTYWTSNRSVIFPLDKVFPGFKHDWFLNSYSSFRQVENWYYLPLFWVYYDRGSKSTPRSAWWLRIECSAGNW